MDAAQGADLLIHEALTTDDAHAYAAGRLHSTSGDAARVAEQASVKQLIITHIDNAFHENLDLLLQDAARTYTGPITAAHDLMQIIVPSS